RFFVQTSFGGAKFGFCGAPLFHMTPLLANPYSLSARLGVLAVNITTLECEARLFLVLQRYDFAPLGSTRCNVCRIHSVKGNPRREALASYSCFSEFDNRIAMTFLTSPFGSFGRPTLRFFSFILHLRDKRCFHCFLWGIHWGLPELL